MRTDRVKEMSKESGKRVCPICHKEYPEEDNYCGNDGAPLEAVETDARSPGAEG